MTNNKLISFDIFDTALFRGCYEPKDVFKIIELKTGNDFFNKRIEAENKAREVNEFYTLNDIYKFLPEFDINLEIQEEENILFANPEIQEIYTPENSIFISDMYLSSEILTKILEKNGYKNPKVFVSCEMKAYKSGGELFKKVQKKLKKKIVKHYGDNYVADIEGAKSAGIKEVVFKPSIHKINLDIPVVKDPFLKSYLARIKNSDIDSIKKLAYYYAPVIKSFTKWVLANRKKGQKIFFLSRDMYMPYIYARFILREPRIFYINVSRKSLAGLCMKSGNKELKRKMSFIFSKKEMKEKLLQDDSETIEYLKQFNINNDDIIVDIGYAGTIQAGINYALGVQTQGFYMQVSKNCIKGLKTKMFLNRMAIHFCLMIEFIFGSNEDIVEGYKNSVVITSPENKKRKILANKITRTILEILNDNLPPEITVFDIEQILIHTQYYPDKDVIEIYNEKIFSNRDRDESIINFDKEEIMKGNLRDLYNRSYCQALFKKLLTEDPELNHLVKLLS